MWSPENWHLEFDDEPDKDGMRERRRVKAKWDPMVDVALFEGVARRLEGEPSAPKRRRRRRNEHPLSVVCGHCGVEYNGAELPRAQGAPRGYSRAKSKARSDAAAAKRMEEAGCKVWYVDAEELETKLKELIVAHRTSPDFLNEVRELIHERDEFR